MTNVKDIIKVDSAIVIGNKEWRCHSNLKLQFVKLSEYHYGIIRRQFNIPSTLKKDKEVMDYCKEHGWSIINTDIRAEVEFACRAILNACNFSSVRNLVYTLPVGNKLTYQQLILDHLVSTGGASVDQIAFDIRTNNRTAIYKLHH